MAITLQVHYHTIKSTLTTYAGSTSPVDGDTIKQMDDISGNGNHIYSDAADPSVNPTYKAASFGYNPKPCLLADGVDDWMSNASITLGTNAIFVVLVFSPETLQSASDIETIVATKNTGQTSPGWAVMAGNAYIHEQYNFVSGEYYDGSTFGGPSAQYFNGPDNLVYDAWQVLQGNAVCMMLQFPSHADSGNGLRLFQFADGYYMGGVKLGELRIYTGTATSTEREAIWEEIKSDWEFGDSLLIPISQSSDDAQEDQLTNAMNLTGNGLSLGYNTDRKIVGLRFNNITAHWGTFLRHARIYFNASADEAVISPEWTIYGQNSTAPATFTTTASDITNRTLTVNNVVMNSIMYWYTGRNYITDELVDIFHEIFRLSGWASGDSAVILIYTSAGTGVELRIAKSYDSSSTYCPILWIEISPEVMRLVNSEITDSNLNGRLIA